MICVVGSSFHCAGDWTDLISLCLPLSAGTGLQRVLIVSIIVLLLSGNRLGFSTSATSVELKSPNR